MAQGWSVTLRLDSESHSRNVALPVTNPLGIGHAWITLTAPDGRHVEFGYYPRETTLSTGFGFHATGELRVRDESHLAFQDAAFTFPLTAAQAARILETAKEIQREPGTYEALTHNCLTVAHYILTSAHVPLPDLYGPLQQVAGGVASGLLGAAGLAFGGPLRMDDPAGFIWMLRLSEAGREAEQRHQQEGPRGDHGLPTFDTFREAVASGLPGPVASGPAAREEGHMAKVSRDQHTIEVYWQTPQGWQHIVLEPKASTSMAGMDLKRQSGDWVHDAQLVVYRDSAGRWHPAQVEHKYGHNGEFRAFQLHTVGPHQHLLHPLSDAPRNDAPVPDSGHPTDVQINGMQHHAEGEHSSVMQPVGIDVLSALAALTPQPPFQLHAPPESSGDSTTGPDPQIGADVLNAVAALEAHGQPTSGDLDALSTRTLDALSPQQPADADQASVHGLRTNGQATESRTEDDSGYNSGPDESASG
jgi:hypothetical protein